MENERCEEKNVSHFKCIIFEKPTSYELLCLNTPEIAKIRVLKISIQKMKLTITKTKIFNWKNKIITLKSRFSQFYTRNEFREVRRRNHRVSLKRSKMKNFSMILLSRPFMFTKEKKIHK